MPILTKQEIVEQLKEQAKANNDGRYVLLRLSILEFNQLLKHLDA